MSLPPIGKRTHDYTSENEDLNEFMRRLDLNDKSKKEIIEELFGLGSLDKEFNDSEEENISLLYVREILAYNALIERYMNEDKWNWYDVLNYDYDKTNEMSHKHGRLHFLHVYEKRLASDNVSYENKLNLYNYIQANITNFDLFR